jgi:hypothetical protein
MGMFFSRLQGGGGEIRCGERQRREKREEGGGRDEVR